MISLTNEGRLEESLWATETLISYGDDLTIRQLVGLLQRRGGSSSGHFILKVQSDVAQLLLDVTNDLTLSCDNIIPVLTIYFENSNNETAYIAYSYLWSQKSSHAQSGSSSGSQSDPDRPDPDA